MGLILAKKRETRVTAFDMSIEHHHVFRSHVVIQNGMKEGIKGIKQLGYVPLWPFSQYQGTRSVDKVRWTQIPFTYVSNINRSRVCFQFLLITHCGISGARCRLCKKSSTMLIVKCQAEKDRRTLSSLVFYSSTVSTTKGQKFQTGKTSLPQEEK